MATPSWYWHRLRAMSPGEVALHLRRKLHRLADARGQRGGSRLRIECSAAFPNLPAVEAAPAGLQEALRRDADRILSGHWTAFGHLELRVDDPPKWHKDYLAGRDLATLGSAFGLDHRELPGGADIKLIWELSRWSQLARLAMAAHVLGDPRAATKCVDWLEDWVTHNPPYRGWNWTSALEVGLRLIQFTWIDALLAAAPQAHPSLQTRLAGLRSALLPAHVRYAWRHRSFGSSANNHLIGELAGLILAIARWPELARFATRLEALRRRWEREVLAQFAEDGGNREQALHYHLFSWECCWQARTALAAAGQSVAPAAEERLRRAARFFCEVQAQQDPWDYGDSDDAHVTPFFTCEATSIAEWQDWLRHAPGGAALGYWLGAGPSGSPVPGVGTLSHAGEVSGWRYYETIGWAVRESGSWWLRWDLSPLGYLKPAAHGHLDALHLSIWRAGVAMVIDPGTGAYYGDRRLRQWLASRAAHNGPCPTGEEWPRRLGPFLWSAHHPRPSVTPGQAGSLVGEMDLPTGRLRRSIAPIEGSDGWQVDDTFETSAGAADFSVRWQFAPGCRVKRLDDRRFRLCRGDITLDLAVGAEWSEAILEEADPGRADRPTAVGDLELEFAGTVSPAFRKVERAPFLKLVARPVSGGKPCVFRSTFLASPHS
jgi:hypothetical protein